MMAISLFYRVYKTVCESSNDFFTVRLTYLDQVAATV